jgi:hypothetical protein
LFIPVLFEILRTDSSFCVSSLSQLIILSIIFWNLVFDISFSLLLFRSLVVELAFEGVCCLTASCFCVEIYTSGVVFGLGIQSLVPPLLEFYEGLYRTGWLISEVLSYLKILGGSGSISIPSALYSPDVAFYSLFHIGKEGLDTKALSVI